MNSHEYERITSIACNEIDRWIYSVLCNFLFQQGDLVQMKPVPCGGSGGVELRAKTVELLVLLHGLRHENLNPLIGCLAEPPRAALVSEWCARGSLQDVLQQDDIKLDWSFRLSLLTDLVRVSDSLMKLINSFNLCNTYK